MDCRQMDCRRMKLYIVRISPCCRIVWLYCVQNNLPVELIDVDVFGGEHRSVEFLRLNPNGEVPVLVDGGTVVYEAVAILLYLAHKYTKMNLFATESEKDKTTVQSLLGWTSTHLHTTVGYRLVYPHFMESYQPGEDATESLIEKGTVEITKSLQILENNFLRDDATYMFGDVATIADYYIATVLVQLEWINFDFKLWSRLSQWLEAVKTSVKGWNEVHEKHNGFVAKLKCVDRE